MSMMTIIGGFLMALADSVPGVSGGTIAFIMGFYDEFINSISLLLKGKKEERKKAFFFLLRVGIGWATGMILAILILNSLFEKNIYLISSMFLGFVLAAIPIIVMEEKKCLKGKYYNLVFTLIGAALVVAITLLKAKLNNGEGGEFHLTVASGVYLFVCGALAICAMVLPGISGSTLLLIFGVYTTVIGAVHSVLTFDLKALPICFIFGFGVIAGAVGIVGILKKCLSRFRSQTIYLVIGLMIGSLYAIVRGPESLDTPQPMMDLHTFSIIFFIIGIAVISGLQLLKVVIEKKGKTENKKIEKV
ncbi:MAG: DUF368 domain-containing protein [Clostridia bacterium]|nr:DUF368 domain-containing protein [Clostridia bacterium]